MTHDGMRQWSIVSLNLLVKCMAPLFPGSLWHGTGQACYTCSPGDGEHPEAPFQCAERGGLLRALHIYPNVLGPIPMPQYAFSARIWQVHHSYMQHNVHIVLQLLQVDGKANQQCRVICFTFLVQDVQVSRTLHSGERSPNHQRCGTYSRTSRGTAVWDSTDSTDLFLYPKKQRIFMDFLYFLKNLPGTFNDLVTDYTRDTQNGVDVSGKMALPVAGWRTAELLCISISIGIGGMANAGTQCRDGSWIWEVQEDSDL